jgi:hypothetical protein
MPCRMTGKGFVCEGNTCPAEKLVFFFLKKRVHIPASPTLGVPAKTLSLIWGATDVSHESGDLRARFRPRQAEAHGGSRNTRMLVT